MSEPRRLPPIPAERLAAICAANEHYKNAKTDAERRRYAVEQLSELVSLACRLGLGEHLSPTFDVLYAIGGLNEGSQDRLLRPKKRPPSGGARPVSSRDAGARAWAAAIAEWFYRSGLTDERAAQEAARAIGRKDINEDHILRWRRQFIGTSDDPAAQRFKRLTDSGNVPGTPLENAYALARTMPRLDMPPPRRYPSNRKKQVRPPKVSKKP